ncbi:hypothetical protein AAFH96_18475 [Polymorphospora sp. 2-325]|uniref:Uncharacterized protein n=1 Tax=Polymorphospora lycopeni TaxID=3140240 RepID=A0ABV5CTJ4_9ACTN
MHTARRETMARRLRQLSQVGDSTVDLVGSWGDVFAPADLAHRSRTDPADPELRLALANFFLGPPEPGQSRRMKVYRLIDEHRPDIVVDALGSATSCSYASDTQQAQHDLLELANAAAGRGRVDHDEGSGKARTEVLVEAALSLQIPIIHRYVEALGMAIRDFGVARVIKVSTTGLGGMGYNCPYTHGSVTETGLSGALVEKLAAAGVLHQLLWNLHHTAGCEISLVVPSALIGWEAVQHGPYVSRGRPVVAQDCPTPVKIRYDLPLAEQELPRSDADEDQTEMVFVPSGDSSTYSRAEMSLSTALGQFESVTREEVAAAVLETMRGSTRFDLLTAMDSAAMQPSYLAAHIRFSVLTSMRDLEAVTRQPSIVSGNLGPAISKDLLELHLICSAAGTLQDAGTMSPDLLADTTVERLRTDGYLRRQILSIGLAVLLPGDMWMAGRRLSVPRQIHGGMRLTRRRIEDWTRQGWIDLRPRNIARWQTHIRGIERHRSALKSLLAIDGRQFDVGEVLAYHYTLTGRARRWTLNGIGADNEGILEGPAPHASGRGADDLSGTAPQPVPQSIGDSEKSG